MWIPHDTDTTGPAHAGPSYVSYLLLGEAIGKPNVPASVYKHLKTGGTNIRVSPLDTPPGLSNQTFAAYALYDGDHPSRLVIINMIVHNVTTTTATTTPVGKDAVTLDISHLFVPGKATLKRMSSPGLDEKNSSYVSWAGQTYADGRARGKEVVEKVGLNGLVTVQASEAVLVFLK